MERLTYPALPLAGGALTGPILLPNGTATNPALAFASAPGIGWSLSGTAFTFYANGATARWAFDGNVFYGPASNFLLTTGGVANPQWGINSATPIAYTHNLAPSSRAGTDTDVAGANATIQPGNGTGTGGSGIIAFKTASPGTTGTSANTMSTRVVIDNNASGMRLPYLALTTGTMNENKQAFVRTAWSSYSWTNAMITALGAVNAGDVTVCTLPAKTIVKNMYVVINTPDTSANALTVACGRTSATYIDYIVASDAKAAANTVYGEVAGERGTNLTGYDMPSFTGTTAVVCHFIKTTSTLSTVLGCTGTVYIETATLP